VSTTAASSSSLLYPKVPVKGWAGGGALLAFLIFLGVPSRRLGWRSMLGVLMLLAAFSGLSACGGSVSGSTTVTNAGTAAGTYTFTVTGTGTPSVSPAPAPATFTVTVN
jgi:hypothetical protein